MTVESLLAYLSDHVARTPDGRTHRVQLVIEGEERPLATVVGCDDCVLLEAEDDDLSDEEIEEKADMLRTWQEIAEEVTRSR